MKHDDRFGDVARLVARSALGASIAAHGAQKLLGWFDGPGLEGAAGFMHQLGFEPGDRYARLSSASEIAAGVLIAAGALGPAGPALLVSVMTTAAGSVHVRNGYFADKKGIELNTLYALAALLLAIDDYGRISIDELVRIRRRTSPLLGIVAIACGVAAGLYVLSQRTERPSHASSETSAPRTSETGTIEPPPAKLDAVE